MENLNVTLEEEIARWVRDRAAQREVSVSLFIGGVLEKEMLQDAQYAEAMKRFLSRKPSRIQESGPYPSRDELHDRPGLR